MQNSEAGSQHSFVPLKMFPEPSYQLSHVIGEQVILQFLALYEKK